LAWYDARHALETATWLPATRSSCLSRGIISHRKNCSQIVFRVEMIQCSQLGEMNTKDTTQFAEG
jgi:hypothetical protein